MRNQFTFDVRPPSDEAASNISALAGGSFGGNPEQIRSLQRTLNRVLGIHLRISGVMDLRTRKAMREFQRRRGSSIAGGVGSQAARGFAAGARAGSGRQLSSPFVFESEGEYEEEGETRARPKCLLDRCGAEYVGWIQRSLNHALGLRLAEDGVTGRNTISAIRSFQRKRGLNPDGAVGPLTEQALVAAGASPPPRPKEMPCGPTSGQELIRLLKKHASDLPVDFLLGWIEVESGRRIDSSTYLCERGYFQIHPEQSQDFHFDHERISFDPDYSIKTGVDVVRRAIRTVEPLARSAGISRQNDAFWALVKLYHWIPSAPRRILDVMRQQGVNPSSWSVVAAQLLRQPNLIPGFDVKDGVNNVQKTLQARDAWRRQIGAGQAQAQESEFEWENGKQTAASVPQLIKSESTPPAQTIYAKITLGAERPAKAMTGIFVPENFQPVPQVDMIIYLHGIKVRPELNIEQYWNKKNFEHFALRERLNLCKRNAILVAPTLGPRSQWQTGWLTKPGGLDRYLEQVIAALAAHGPYKDAKPHVGNIILACHSGGGQPMRELALAQNKLADNIKECWGFDCTYYGADLTGWPNWSKSRTNAKLYLYYRPNTQTAINAKKIQAMKLPNVSVLTSSVGHNWVPIKHWQERVEQSPVLRPIGGTATQREFMNPHFWTPQGEAHLAGVEDEYYAEVMGFESELESEFEVPINAGKAAASNAKLMKSVGWAPHADVIASKLLGIAATPPDHPDFAQAVAEWQKRNCFSTVDGVIGGETWGEMSVILGLAATPAPRPPIPQCNTLMPKAGLGFCNRSQSRRYGLPETILALVQSGMLWAAKHPTGPRIMMWDISKRGGGKFDPHKSHRIGLDIDIGLMRNDGKESGVRHYKTDPSYSQALTQDLCTTIRNNGVLPVKCIFFNDKTVTGVQEQSGHNNHIHVRFCMPDKYKGVLKIKDAYVGATKSPPSYTCPPFKC